MPNISPEKQKKRNFGLKFPTCLRDGSKKARLVVVRCAQRPGMDFDQTHCSTLKSTSLQFLAATAAIQAGPPHAPFRTFDFVSAFLQGDLEQAEQILCRPPPGYETLGDDGNHRIWRVLRPIYGMQQGGRRWQRCLFPWIISHGLSECDADNCVFSMTTADDALYVGCYVDDLLSSSYHTSRMAPAHHRLFGSQLWGGYNFKTFGVKDVCYKLAAPRSYFFCHHLSRKN